MSLYGGKSTANGKSTWISGIDFSMQIWHIRFLKLNVKSWHDVDDIHERKHNLESLIYAIVSEKNL